jgi:hypothetical protein
LKAVADLRAAETNRANTVKLERLDGEIRTANKEKLDLGPIPSETNPGAARIGKLLAKFVDMGPRPDLVVTDWWPTGVAIVIEWIGLVLPRMILTAVGMVERRPRRLRALLDRMADRWQEAAPAPEVMQRLAAARRRCHKRTRYKLGGALPLLSYGHAAVSEPRWWRRRHDQATSALSLTLRPEVQNPG